MDFSVSGTGRRSSSNTVALVVAERLDVRLELGPQGRRSVDGDAVIAAILTNVGSGTEAFHLATTGEGLERERRVYLDVDADGVLDAADLLLTDARSPALAPGEQRALIFVVRETAPNITLTLSASAVTGTGAPGTGFAGQGDGGGDAVVGPTGARAEVVVAPGAPASPVTLTKSQQVRDRRGGSVPESGAIVTYTLVAAFAGPVSDAVISDAIPAGTRVVPNSLTLDGAALSDAADADAGTSGADSIRVTLGSQAATARRTVTFQVTIQ